MRIKEDLRNEFHEVKKNKQMNNEKKKRNKKIKQNVCARAKNNSNKTLKMPTKSQ